MEDEKTKINNNEVIFFLGAGASVKAGVPVTRKFVEKFEERINRNENGKKEALTWILNILKSKKKPEDIIDVELLLETLHKLNNMREDVLTKFSDPLNELKKHESALKELEKELRQFIREKTIVKEEKIVYLEPLRSFINKYEVLDIFSVNYDTCIEQFCKRYSKEYTDGFELHWNHKLFDENKYEVKHYKLHGSVMWYLTNKNMYMKIPIKAKEGEEIELITGETAKNLMVYPMENKREYSEPLSELIVILRKKLEKAKVCVVIGYSFRDKDILTLFFEATRKNKDLILYLIDPYAGEIYKNKLKFTDEDKTIPSSFELDRRVICWNYPIENSLKDNYLYQSISNLSKINQQYKEADNKRREIRDMHNYELQQCVLDYIDIGYISKAEEILKEYLNITSLNDPRYLSLFSINNDTCYHKFRFYYILGVYHIYNGNYKKAKEYFEEFRDILNESLDAGKKYFSFWERLKNIESQSLNDKSKETSEKNEINQKIKEIEDKYKYLPFYRWFKQYDWGSYLLCFIKFLDKQKELRSEKDEFKSVFAEVTNKCKDMKKCLEIRYKEGIYKDSEPIDVGNTGVEPKRKLDSEKKLEEIINSLDKLITLCEQKIK